MLMPVQGLNLFVAVGNDYRRDDGVGLYIYKNICKAIKGKNIIKTNNGDSTSIIEFFNAGSIIENYVFDLIAKEPKKIIIIDAANFSQKTGDVGIFNIGNLPDTSLSTHNIPLSVIISVIKSEINTEIVFLGIQYEDISFGEELSKYVRFSADKVVDFIFSLFLA